MSHGTVYVVDDDASVRGALDRRLSVEGYAVKTYGSASDFLAVHKPESAPACLLLDVKMPGMTGLELQRELNARGFDLPIVFLTAHGDVPMSANAFKAGACDFLLKPFQDAALIAAVGEAMGRSVARAASRAVLDDARLRLGRLTPRERQILGLVVAGMTSKEIAVQLGLAEITVKVHRVNISRKTGAGSLAELVRLATVPSLNRPERAAIGDQ